MSVSIDPAACRQTGPPAVRWETDGRGSISVSSDARLTGDAVLRCRVPVPAGAGFATLSFARVRVSFQPAAFRDTGSGLLLQIGRNCRAELIRVAGEDWIESRERAWTVRVPPGARRLEIILTARDVSPKVPLRVDLEGLRLAPGQPQNAEICESVDNELHRDRGQHQSH